MKEKAVVRRAASQDLLASALRSFRGVYAGLGLTPLRDLEAETDQAMLWSC